METIARTFQDNMSTSQIRDFYDKQSIFITGGTGFMGRILIEKLLRATDVAKIYVLIKPKHGKDSRKRLAELLDDVLFRKVSATRPDYRSRVVASEGDCIAPYLGLSSAEREDLVADVNIVFHVAATVKFNENIKLAYDINVKGTANLICFCKQMKRLKSFVHVSTAFSNYHVNVIMERFYDYSFRCEDTEKMLNKLSAAEANKMTPVILGDCPNTYLFTKALGETVVREKSGDLPVGIFRPGIVISTYKEPIEGWTDSFGGPAAALVGSALGVVRIYSCDPDLPAELVPVDMSISALMAVAWDITTKPKPHEIPIYNYVSSTDNSLTWLELAELVKIQFVNYPYSGALWTPMLRIMKASFYFDFLKVTLHYIPALVIDLVLLVSLKKPTMIAKYQKIHNLCSLLEPFSNRKWLFDNTNVKKLWMKMGDEDKSLFHFDFEDMNWLHYMRNYNKGLRLYLMKDPLSTLSRAKMKAKGLEFAHHVIIFVIYLIGINLVWAILSTIFI